MINTALPGGFTKCKSCAKEGRSATLSVEKNGYRYCSYTQLCKQREKIKEKPSPPPVDLEFAHPAEVMGTLPGSSNFGKLICEQVERNPNTLRGRLDKLTKKRRGGGDAD